MKSSTILPCKNTSSKKMSMDHTYVVPHPDRLAAEASEIHTPFLQKIKTKVIDANSWQPNTSSKENSIPIVYSIARKYDKFESELLTFIFIRKLRES